MNYSQTTMPTAEEIAQIERRARAMRAEVTAAGLVGFGRWVSRLLRGSHGAGTPAKA